MMRLRKYIFCSFLFWCEWIPLKKSGSCSKHSFRTISTFTLRSFCCSFDFLAFRMMMILITSHECSIHQPSTKSKLCTNGQNLSLTSSLRVFRMTVIFHLPTHTITVALKSFHPIPPFSCYVGTDNLCNWHETKARMTMMGMAFHKQKHFHLFTYLFKVLVWLVLSVVLQPLQLTRCEVDQFLFIYKSVYFSRVN